jgi:hypothetical protein
VLDDHGLEAEADGFAKNVVTGTPDTHAAPSSAGTQGVAPAAPDVGAPVQLLPWWRRVIPFMRPHVRQVGRGIGRGTRDELRDPVWNWLKSKFNTVAIDDSDPRRLLLG